MGLPKRRLARDAMQYLVLLLWVVAAGCTATKMESAAQVGEVEAPLAMPTLENTFLLDGPDYSCSAFAIDAHWAVTAAHCIIPGEAPSLLGDGPRRLVRQAMTHP